MSGNGLPSHRQVTASLQGFGTQMLKGFRATPEATAAFMLGACVEPQSFLHTPQITPRCSALDPRINLRTGYLFWRPGYLLLWRGCVGKSILGKPSAVPCQVESSTSPGSGIVQAAPDGLRRTFLGCESFFSGAPGASWET